MLCSLAPHFNPISYVNVNAEENFLETHLRLTGSTVHITWPEFAQSVSILRKNIDKQILTNKS